MDEIVEKNCSIEDCGDSAEYEKKVALEHRGYMVCLDLCLSHFAIFATPSDIIEALKK